MLKEIRLSLYGNIQKFWSFLTLSGIAAITKEEGFFFSFLQQ